MLYLSLEWVVTPHFHYLLSLIHIGFGGWLIYKLISNNRRVKLFHVSIEQQALRLAESSPISAPQKQDNFSHYYLLPRSKHNRFCIFLFLKASLEKSSEQITLVVFRWQVNESDYRALCTANLYSESAKR